MLNDQQLALVREYSGLFLNPEEIAVLLDVEYEDFSRLIKNKKTPEYKAYMKGKTETKVEIRRNIILMAKNGSPQAEVLSGKFMSDQAVSETDL